MRLNVRIERLEQRCPAIVARRKVPTGSFEEFVSGYAAGAFSADDLDPADFTHTTFAARLNVLLVVMSPKHRAWCDATPWAPKPEDTLAEYSVPVRDAIQAIAGAGATSF